MRKKNNLDLTNYKNQNVILVEGMKKKNGSFFCLVTLEQ